MEELMRYLESQDYTLKEFSTVCVLTESVTKNTLRISMGDVHIADIILKKKV